jgi:hypothetical protein
MLYRWSGTVEFGMQQLDFPLLTLGYGFVSLIYLILGTTTFLHVKNAVDIRSMIGTRKRNSSTAFLCSIYACKTSLYQIVQNKCSFFNTATVKLYRWSGTV